MTVVALATPPAPRHVRLHVQSWRWIVCLPARCGATGVALTLECQGDDGQSYGNFVFCTEADEYAQRGADRPPRNALGLVPEHGNDGYVVTTFEQMHAIAAGLATDKPVILDIEICELDGDDNAITHLFFASRAAD